MALLNTEGFEVQRLKIFSEISGRAGFLRIDRPEVLDAIDEEVVLAIISTLSAWRSDPDVSVVMIDLASSPAGVSAGTDVCLLSRRGNWDIRGVQAFLAAHYQLIDLLIHFPKPIVSLMNGRLLGSAVGMAMAAHYRIVTPATSFRFPETEIGLVPDAGSTWFLSRLRDRAGYWLSMTGERLTGTQIFHLGLASHVVCVDGLQSVRNELAAEGIAALPPANLPRPTLWHPHQIEMRDCFSGHTVQHMCSLLERGSDWAGEQAVRIAAKSPLSLAILLRQLQTGALLSAPREALRLEYRILSRLLCTSNFREGVRAAFARTPSKPKWSPESLSQTRSDTIAPFFAPPREGELQFLHQK